MAKKSTPENLSPTGKDVKAAAAKQNDRLDDVQLIPKDAERKPKYKGIELLKHMIKVRNMRFTEEVRRGPTPGLDVHLMEDSLEMIQPTAEDMRRRNILKDHCGERAKRTCTQRKLNYIWLVIGHSAVVKYPENMKRMQKKLDFASACAEINRI